MCSGFEVLVFDVSRYDAGLVFPVGLLGNFSQLLMSCGFKISTRLHVVSGVST